jgi:delta8-fatty-acid desaturase
LRSTYSVDFDIDNMSVDVAEASSSSTVLHSGKMDKQPQLLSREEIAQRICQGALLFIYRSNVINATQWAKHHPGGALAILHFVGRDATDEVEAYHSPSAIARMLKMRVGRVEVDQEEGWRALTPPIALGLVQHPDGVKGHWISEGPVVLGASMNMAGVNQEVVVLSPEQLEPLDTILDRKQEQLRSRAYHDLKSRIKEAGLFDRPGPLSGYGSDLLRYAALGGSAFALYFL